MTNNQQVTVDSIFDALDLVDQISDEDLATAVREIIVAVGMCPKEDRAHTQLRGLMTETTTRS